MSGVGCKRAGLFDSGTKKPAGGARRSAELDAMELSEPEIIALTYHSSAHNFTGLPKAHGRKGAGFQAIQDGIDTNISGGKLVFHIMGALAEFERDLISERTVAGMGAARRRGKHVGRPSALTPAQIKHAKRLITSEEETIAGMANLLGVHRNTLTRAINS